MLMFAYQAPSRLLLLLQRSSGSGDSPNTGILHAMWTDPSQPLAGNFPSMDVVPFLFLLSFALASPCQKPYLEIPVYSIEE